MESILILGASGLVGKALCNQLKDKYNIYGTYNNREFDIKGINKIKFQLDNYKDINNILNKYKPTRIINALTGDFDKQLKIIEELVKFSNKSNAYIYFISTWNVFDEYPYKIY